MRKTQVFRDARKLQDLAERTAAIEALPKKPTYRDRLDEPYIPPSEFEQRLHNWKRAHRWIKSADTNHTFPAYRYCRSQIGVEVEYLTGETPHARPDPIDWEDAWEMELAWRGIPRDAHWILKLHIHDVRHQWARTAKWASRMLRQLCPPIFVHHDDWEAAVTRAKTELEMELDLRRLAGTAHSYRSALQARFQAK